MRVLVQGVGPFRYQWQKDNQNIPNETRETILFPMANFTNQGDYRVIIFGSTIVTSAPARLKVNPLPPRITVQPNPQLAFSESDAIFSVKAIGTSPMIYQWRLNGVDITDANTDTLKITNVLAPNQGLYSVYIKNVAGETVSKNAVLTMTNLLGTKKWEFQTGLENGVKSIYSSPAVNDDETVYIGAADGVLYAINGKTGVEKWRFQTGAEIESSPAISDDSTVYVGSKDFRLYALDGVTGNKKWEFVTKGEVNSSPAIGEDGTIYVGSNDGFLYAINPSTGVRKWGFKIGDRVYASPSISSTGVIVIGSYDGKIYGVEASTGEKKWEYVDVRLEGSRYRTSAAISYDGVAYIPGRRIMYAIECSTGYLKWSKDPSIDGISRIINTDGSICVGGFVYDRQIGNLRVLRDLTGPSAIGADGTMYIGGADSLWAINSTTGDIRWRHYTGAVRRVTSSPTIGPNGTIYFGSENGKIYALASDSLGLANSSWPMDGGESKHQRRVGSVRISPSVSKENINNTVIPGGRLELKPNVVGTVPLSFQWIFKGVNISGANSRVLTITNFQSSHQGEYYLRVSNSWGCVTSLVANIGIAFPNGYKKWEALTQDYHRSTPAICTDGSIIYTAGNRKIFKVDKVTGTKYTVLPENKFFSSPSVDLKGAAYAVCDGINNIGVLYSINIKSGLVNWTNDSQRFGPMIRSQSISSDGMVFVSNFDTVIGYDGLTGVAKWFFSESGLQVGPPSIDSDGNIVLAGSRGDSVIMVIDRVTLNKKWEILEKDGDNFSSTAIGSDGTIYAGSRSGKVCAFDGKSGVKKWIFLSGGGISSSPSIGSDGSIYVGCLDRKVYAIDGNSGNTKWEFVTGGNVEATPTIGLNGVVYVGSGDGKMYALDPKTGDELWSVTTGGSIFSAASLDSDGTLFFGSGDGKMYAIATDSYGLARSSWPKVYADNQNTGRISQSFAPLTIRYSQGLDLILNVPVSPDLDTILEYSTNLSNWTEVHRIGRRSDAPSVVVPLKTDVSKSTEFWRTKQR